MHRRFHRTLLRQGSLRGRRGSALLIVLALLSLLVLLATTLAFTSRIETMSSHNFSRAVQAETTVLSTLGAASIALSQAVPADAVGPLDLVRLAAVPTYDAHTARGGAAAYRTRPTFLSQTDLTSARVEDASARVNLNAADEATMAVLFDEVARRHGLTANATTMARRVAAWRLGPDGEPGNAGQDDNQNARFMLPEQDYDARFEAAHRRQRLDQSCEGRSDEVLQRLTWMRDGIGDPDEYVADIRRPAFGDDKRLQDVDELLLLGFPADFVDALRPYVTLFSVSVPPLRRDPSGNRVELVDINRASAIEIYQALVTTYGTSKNDTLMRQFAVNVVDARDHDMLPTVLPSTDGSGVVIGFERTPYITEVYPESRAVTPEDDGEFVEIYNPWPESFDLSGWTVSVNGKAYPLAGSIAPRGYMIVTDNYDRERAGEDDLGLSSFYDVHGVVVAPPGKRMAEFAEFDLPHGTGNHRVELRARGHLIDRFDYRMVPGMSTHQSFQRRGNGAVREVVVADVSPYRLLGASAELPTPDALFPGPRDVEFTSVMDLFEVFTGFADREMSVHWSTPVLALPTAEQRDSAAARGVLDARLVDIFTVEYAERPGVAEVAKDMSRTAEPMLEQRQLSLRDGSSAAVLLDAEGRPQNSSELDALSWDRYLSPSRGLRHGLININTASEPVLRAAGFSPAQARMLALRRDAMLAGALEGRPTSGLLYESIAEMLGDEDLWRAERLDRCERLARARLLTETTTVTSRAFLLEGQARQSAESSHRGNSGLKVQALVALDLPQPEIVSWAFEY